MCYIDNIQLLNRLTHSKNGLVIDGSMAIILNNYRQYKDFKKLLSYLQLDIKNVEPLSYNDSEISFTIKLSKEQISLLEKTDTIFKHKGKKTNIIYMIGDDDLNES